MVLGVVHANKESEAVVGLRILGIGCSGWNGEVGGEFCLGLSRPQKRMREETQ